ncbi:MAG TPA: hypothetical protein VG055_17235 [Planctomycetaceae bacterium]|nr:hypothetical protein [Planctomycetaceae bacterium]
MSETLPKQNAALELLKSVLVIPVVVAIVMGIGYGLTRVAERKEAASGKSDVRPADTAADGSITLSTDLAVVTGQISRHEISRDGSSRHDSIIDNWRHLGDFVLFHFPLEKPGRYAVELIYSCDSANAGSTVQIQLADSTSILKVADTGGSVNYKPFRVGEANLPDAHWYNLKISPTEIAHETVMALKGVKLIPVKQ